MRRYTALVLCLLLALGARATENPAGPGKAVNGLLSGEQAFAACASCHSLDPAGIRRVGPHLYGLRGRQAGALPDFAYSPALVASGIVWDTDTLSTWIVATEHFVPGTWMLYENVLRPKEIPALVEYILRQEGN